MAAPIVVSGFARKDEVVAFKITEMASIATTTAGLEGQDICERHFEQIRHERRVADTAALSPIELPDTVVLTTGLRKVLDGGACDNVRPGSKYVSYHIPYRTDCGSFSTSSHDPKRSDNQLPARPPQPDYYSPTGQMIHKQRLVAMLNQCPAMKSKDRLQRIAKVNVG